MHGNVIIHEVQIIHQIKPLGLYDAYLELQHLFRMPFSLLLLIQYGVCQQV